LVLCLRWLRAEAKQLQQRAVRRRHRGRWPAGGRPVRHGLRRPGAEVGRVPRVHPPCAAVRPPQERALQAPRGHPQDHVRSRQLQRGARVGQRLGGSPARPRAGDLGGHAPQHPPLGARGLQRARGHEPHRGVGLRSWQHPAGLPRRGRLLRLPREGQRLGRVPHLGRLACAGAPRGAAASARPVGRAARQHHAGGGPVRPAVRLVALLRAAGHGPLPDRGAAGPDPGAEQAHRRRRAPSGGLSERADHLLRAAGASRSTRTAPTYTSCPP